MKRSRCRGELLRSSRQRVGAPVLRAVQQDADGLDLVRVLADERGEGREVVLGLVLLAVRASDQPLRGDVVLGLVARRRRCAAAAGSRPAGPGSPGSRSSFMVAGEVALSQPAASSRRSGPGRRRGCKRRTVPRLAGHLLVDALEALDQAADVVVAVAVLPDVLDDLARSCASASPAARR